MNKLANIILITIILLVGCEPEVDLSTFTGNPYTGWEDVSPENDTANGNEDAKDNEEGKELLGDNDTIGVPGENDEEKDKPIQEPGNTSSDESEREKPKVPIFKSFPIEKKGFTKVISLAYVLPEKPSNDAYLSSTGSFSLTANKGYSRRGELLSTNSSPANIPVVEPSNSKGIEFDNYLRNLENELLSQPPAISSRSTALSKKNKPVNVGDEKSFYVLIDNKDVLTTSKCIFTTDTVAFFLDKKVNDLSQNRINQLKRVAEIHIPYTRETFAKEEDIDGNGQVFFLLTPLNQGIIGYFYTADRYIYAQGASTKSNQCEILYLNSHYINNDIQIEATMVHEFQHLVMFDYRRKNNLQGLPLWLNEGLSMLSEYLCGYGGRHTGYINGAFKDMGKISLIEHPSTGNHYGYALLFTRYLQERFGVGFIKKLYDSKEEGIFGVCEAVEVEDFNELFTDFVTMIANTGQGGSNDPKYNIENFNYANGTEGYKKNGFCIRALVNYDSMCKSSQIEVENMKPYSFYAASWWDSNISSMSGMFNNVELIVAESFK